jgi:uncharacterized cupin superfamily protein
MREPQLRQRLLPWLLPLGLTAGIAAGGLPGLRSTASLRPAAAADNASPAIVPISLGTPTTENFVYPPQVPVGNFDGAYKEATVYRSGVYAGNRVAFWESEAGGLRASDYPKDEFIYVLEGSVLTTDANGTKHEFHAGDAFVLPRGSVGLWEMKAHFKKIIVNF